MPHRCIKPLCDSMGCVMCNCAVPEDNMTAKTSTERAQELRQRRTEAGLTEVRGIWAPAAIHAEIREQAAKLAKRRARQELKGTGT